MARPITFVLVLVLSSLAAARAAAQDGACCAPNHDCFVASQALCESFGGEYQGDGTTCDPDPCPGACCLADGTCVVAGPDGCASMGGSFQGADQSCDDVECVGACCVPGGACDVASPEDCASAGGDYQGDGTTCGPPCPGACCLEDGCTVMMPDDCLAQFGEFQGPGTTCERGCPPVGACCRSDLPCVVTTELACEKLGGPTVYAGDGTDCEACEGACCWFLGGPVCSQATCHDCFKSLMGNFQGIGTDCSVCPGHCCFPDGTCSGQLTEKECLAQNGIFQFDKICAFPPDLFICGNPCAGDANTDGFTNVDDILAVIMDWNCGTGSGPPGPCDGDVTDDGVTDVDDLVAVILDWGCVFTSK